MTVEIGGSVTVPPAVTLRYPMADPIVRPDEPNHSMTLEPASEPFVARVGEQVLARSERALVLREFGKSAYPPVIYFPRQDVSAPLQSTDVVTTCPLKGTAVAYDVAGVERGAWSYTEVLGFDARLAQIEGRVAFDGRRVTVEPGS